MSDERGEPIDLAYLGRALQRLTADVAGLKARRADRLGGIEDRLDSVDRRVGTLEGRH